MLDLKAIKTLRPSNPIFSKENIHVQYHNLPAVKLNHVLQNRKQKHHALCVKECKSATLWIKKIILT